MKTLLAALAILWASPWSLLGLLVGLTGLATGGGVQRRGRVLEFWGGLVTWLLRHAPLPSEGAMAMTLGHTVLGQTRAALDLTRDHEAVHVRQYEIWGLFFIPAYFACSLVLRLAGKDAYRDNPFEKQAYDKAP